MGDKADLTVYAKLDQLDTVLGLVQKALSESTCPPKIQKKILVCAEELFVNVVNYAYGSVPGKFTLELEINDTDTGGQISICMKDHGVPFDPLQHKTPELTASAEDRKIGGLGIYMVRNIMDQISYEYLEQKNIVRMTKKWQSQDDKYGR